MRGTGYYNLCRDALLDFLRGTVNAKGQLRENLELFAPSPLVLSAVPRTAGDGAVEDGLLEESSGEGTEGEQGFGWTFSTWAMDRYQERVDPSGWELDHYRANPVVQWAHDWELPAIGRAEGVASDAAGLHGRVVFNAKAVDPFGWAIGERVRNKVLRAGSVGFLVLEVELPKQKDPAEEAAIIFRRQELLEFSICNVPANPFALVKNRDEEADVLRKLNSRRAGFWGSLLGGEDAYGY